MEMLFWALPLSPDHREPVWENERGGDGEGEQDGGISLLSTWKGQMSFSPERRDGVEREERERDKGILPKPQC